MTEQRFLADLQQHEQHRGVFFELPFDPKAVFGKVRAPVTVTIRGYTFRTTIARMGGRTFIGINATHRAGARVEGGERVRVVVAEDRAPRTVEVPPDLARALAAAPAMQAAWDKLAYTCQREHVEALTTAKRAETRARRLLNLLAALA